MKDAMKAKVREDRAVARHIKKFLDVYADNGDIQTLEKGCLYFTTKSGAHYLFDIKITRVM